MAAIRATVDALVRAPFAALAAVDPASAEDKRARMRASPYAFYRATLALQLSTLARRVGADGPWVWAVGDPHLGNFATLATGRARDADGPRVVFDVSDGDDEHPGPWAWDLLRCVASLGLARDLRARELEELWLAAGARYREVLARGAEGDAEHGARVYVQDLPRCVADLLAADGAPRARAAWLRKTTVSGRALKLGGKLRADAAAKRELLPALARALADLPRPPRLVDLCRRDASGVSSLGRRRWLALAIDDAPGQPRRAIEIKERRPSELARIVPALPDHALPPRGAAVTVPLGGDAIATVLPGATWPLLARTRCHARSTLEGGAIADGDLVPLARLLATLLARFHLHGLARLGVDVARRAAALADDVGARARGLRGEPRALIEVNASAYRAWRD